MSHQAIYRKFRPKIFDDVLGQEHVTRTLKNQIMSQNIAHAYLFSGIRGTGKTSTAKIFARAVNCLNNHEGNPCNECEICISILDETNMDVIEMDAASNNGVDDIRELRDKVMFLPVKSKYKVYIIDEVHMLSKGAFNALLKTLEEPPEHLLFILATTEPQKIPATILSRCQRFDLKRINADIIVENMKKICNELEIKYEEKALKLIAANSEGAMRDAQSILDRCISFNSQVDYDTVINLLGTVNYQVILEAVEAIADKNIVKTMSLVDNILNSGKELTFFLDELIICFRNMLIIKTTNSSDNLMRISEDETNEIKELNKKISVEEIVKIIEELSIAQSECKKALNPRVLLETKLIKMLHNVHYVNLDVLVERIENIESSINGKYQPKDAVKEPESTENIERTIKTASAKKTEKEDILKTEKIENVDKNKEEVLENKQQNKSDQAIFDAIINEWQSLLKEIRRENAGLQAIIRESKLTEVINKKAVFEFDSKFTFHINAANQPKNKEEFKEILSRFLNEKCEVEFITKKEIKSVKPKTTIKDVYEDLKNEFGEIVEYKQED
ncbi:MAG TPA: DNA polymerase III subunit gamma/tau [Sedimentibacter sp.]|nr:DNA polymerase III subunit gamma/tau [Tissierellia bacterium]HPB79538.1 DNA polymerase III subunit gamma/tau [Sedimentibacter sp.]HQO94891.1 DNA polymerase III subunit gamma/tau [Sedimentibacter sp.]